MIDRNDFIERMTAVFAGEQDGRKRAEDVANELPGLFRTDTIALDVHREVAPTSLPWNNNSWDVAAQIAIRWHRATTSFAATTDAFINTPLVLRARPDPIAQVLLQTVVAPDKGADKGKLIVAVLTPWFDIIEMLKKDPSAAFQIPAHTWEEMAAGAYKQAGFDNVILTPRGGDYGRDVIAEKKGLGIVRVIDSVKAFKPPNLVTANDVRALMGVLQTDGAAKGFLTTTSDFAPLISKDRLITPFIPSRLELINGQMLLARLGELAATQQAQTQERKTGHADD